LLGGELRSDRLAAVVAALGAIVALVLIPIAPAGVPVIAASAAALLGLARETAPDLEEEAEIEGDPVG
jgi:hypothetical protein